jgi:hypothetical protein
MIAVLAWTGIVLAALAAATLVSLAFAVIAGAWIAHGRHGEAIDGLARTVTCPHCCPDPAGDCTCGGDCTHRFCRWAPPLTGLNREDHAFLDGDRSMP